MVARPGAASGSMISEMRPQPAGAVHHRRFLEIAPAAAGRTPTSSQMASGIEKVMYGSTRPDRC